jgi:hypothetical protein
LDFEPSGGPKLPGKTKFSGRRRVATRTSGFHVSDKSGNELQAEKVRAIRLKAKERLVLDFYIPEVEEGSFVGFGVWFLTSFATVPNVQVVEGHIGKLTLTPSENPDWGKVGSVWNADGSPVHARVTFEANARMEVALWGAVAGSVAHKHLDEARPELLSNMYAFAPEAIFIDQLGSVETRIEEKGVALPSLRTGDERVIFLKACNRCARFLPINLKNERIQLSFSNHCVAAQRRPCKHATFGRLVNQATQKTVQLEYGFQLECRFCKKFEVNAAHNPQRTASQMKEDATRRRAFEVLLTELYGGSPDLLYRHKTHKELTEVTWEKFGGRCFKCNVALGTPKKMRRDHTRPLALLWPMDETATALCETHNSQKRDRPPVEFYSPDEIRKLARITGISLEELQSPVPNMDAIRRLGTRLDWFFSVFLVRPEFTKIRDGKTAADLLTKALQKALDRSPSGAPFDLLAEFERRRKGK